MELLNQRIARVIMKWDIEEYPSGSIFAYTSEGIRVALKSPYHRRYTWDPVNNNDDMDSVIEKMRSLGYRFILDHGQTYARATFTYRDEHMFSGIDEDKLVSITKALIDFMDFKEALNNEH